MSDTVSRKAAIECVNRYARQCDAAFVVDEINELPASDGWQPIETIPESKAGGNAVLIFSPILRDEPDFPGHPIVISNPAYAWKNAAKDGYTHWMPLPPPPAD